MLLIKLWLWLFLFKTNEALLCYNCSSTHSDWKRCGGDFVPSMFTFNSTRNFLVNCTEENAMCFVRSWSARAQHAWIVQRGCYHPTADDPLPRSMTIPRRAMTCKHERKCNDKVLETYIKVNPNPTIQIDVAHGQATTYFIHPEAEYKVCLCQADWCNPASSILPSIAQYLLKLITFSVGSFIIF